MDRITSHTYIKRAVSLLLSFAFLFTSIDPIAAQELARQASQSTLSPTSRFNPITETGTFKEDAAFLYFASVAARGIRLNLSDEALKEQIEKDIKEKEIPFGAEFDRYDYKNIYKQEKAFFLPYTHKFNKDRLLFKCSAVKSGDKSKGGMRIPLGKGRDLLLEVIRPEEARLSAPVRRSSTGDFIEKSEGGSGAPEGATPSKELPLISEETEVALKKTVKGMLKDLREVSTLFDLKSVEGEGRGKIRIRARMSDIAKELLRYRDDLNAVKFTDEFKEHAAKVLARRQERAKDIDIIRREALDDIVKTVRLLNEGKDSAADSSLIAAIYRINLIWVAAEEARISYGKRIFPVKVNVERNRKEKKTIVSIRRFKYVNNAGEPVKEPDIWRYSSVRQASLSMSIEADKLLGEYQWLTGSRYKDFKAAGVLEALNGMQRQILDAQGALSEDERRRFVQPSIDDKAKQDMIKAVSEVLRRLERVEVPEKEFARICLEGIRTDLEYNRTNRAFVWIGFGRDYFDLRRQEIESMVENINGGRRAGLRNEIIKMNENIIQGRKGTAGAKGALRNLSRAGDKKAREDASRCVWSMLNEAMMHEPEYEYLEDSLHWAKDAIDSGDEEKIGIARKILKGAIEFARGMNLEYKFKDELRAEQEKRCLEGHPAGIISSRFFDKFRYYKKKYKWTKESERLWWLRLYRDVFVPLNIRVRSQNKWQMGPNPAFQAITCLVEMERRRDLQLVLSFLEAPSRQSRFKNTAKYIRDIRVEMTKKGIVRTMSSLEPDERLGIISALSSDIFLDPRSETAVHEAYLPLPEDKSFKKRVIREESRCMALILPREEVLAAAEAVKEKILAHPRLHQKETKVILCYLSFDYEVMTWRDPKGVFAREEFGEDCLIESLLNMGKRVAVPAPYYDGTMALCEITLQDLQGSDFERTIFGVSAPKRQRLVDKKDIGLVIMPGRFDMKGHRVGKGLGYYNRFLQSYRESTLPLPYTIGVGYDFQLSRQELPYTASDITVDEVITPRGRAASLSELKEKCYTRPEEVTLEERIADAKQLLKSVETLAKTSANASARKAIEAKRACGVGLTKIKALREEGLYDDDYLGRMEKELAMLLAQAELILPSAYKRPIKGDRGTTGEPRLSSSGDTAEKSGAEFLIKKWVGRLGRINEAGFKHVKKALSKYAKSDARAVAGPLAIALGDIDPICVKRATEILREIADINPQVVINCLVGALQDVRRAGLASRLLLEIAKDKTKAQMALYPLSRALGDGLLPHRSGFAQGLFINISRISKEHRDLVAAFLRETIKKCKTRRFLSQADFILSVIDNYYDTAPDGRHSVTLPHSAGGAAGRAPRRSAAGEVDAKTAEAPRDGIAPEKFYVSTDRHTEVFIDGKRREVKRPFRRGAIVIRDGEPRTLLLSEIKEGDKVILKGRGISVSKPAKRGKTRIESARDVARELIEVKKRGGKTLIVCGPAVIHTGAYRYLMWLAENGFINRFFAVNAVAVHDIEGALYGTSLGSRAGKNVKDGHELHLRAINFIRRIGSILEAIRQGHIRDGLMYFLYKNKIPIVLAGSYRDDGPLPEVIIDKDEALRAMIDLSGDADLALMLASTLQSGAGMDILPYNTKEVVVDVYKDNIDEVIKGSANAYGIKKSVDSFLRRLIKELKEMMPEDEIVDLPEKDRNYLVNEPATPETVYREDIEKFPVEIILRLEGDIIDEAAEREILHIINPATLAQGEPSSKFIPPKRRVGLAQDEPSFYTIKVFAKDDATMKGILDGIRGLDIKGVTINIEEETDAELSKAPSDMVFPDNSLITPSYDMEIKKDGKWIRVKNPKMDSCIRCNPDGTAETVKLCDVKRGDLIVTGGKGARQILPGSEDAEPEDKFAFMTSKVSSEHSKSPKIELAARGMLEAKQSGSRVMFVVGEAALENGGDESLVRLIEDGRIDIFCCGNGFLWKDAIGAGIKTLSRQRQLEEETRFINKVRSYGSLEAAKKEGLLGKVASALIDNKIPIVAPGSIRDINSLPGVETNFLAAQHLMMDQFDEEKNPKRVGFIGDVASMLLEIGTGNLAPFNVMTIAVDKNPAVLTKIIDRGTIQAVGLEMDADDFLEELCETLEKIEPVPILSSDGGARLSASGKADADHAQIDWNQVADHILDQYINLRVAESFDISQIMPLNVTHEISGRFYIIRFEPMDMPISVDPFLQELQIEGKRPIKFQDFTTGQETEYIYRVFYNKFPTFVSDEFGAGDLGELMLWLQAKHDDTEEDGNGRLSTSGERVRDKTLELTAGLESDREKFDALFGFVKNGIRYGFAEWNTEAPDTLKNLYGQCGNKVDLMFELLAAVGIKAHYKVVTINRMENFWKPLIEADEEIRKTYEQFVPERHHHIVGEALIGGEWMTFDPSFDDDLVKGFEAIGSPIEMPPYVSVDDIFNSREEYFEYVKERMSRPHVKDGREDFFSRVNKALESTRARAIESGGKADDFFIPNSSPQIELQQTVRHDIGQYCAIVDGTIFYHKNEGLSSKFMDSLAQLKEQLGLLHDVIEKSGQLHNWQNSFTKTFKEVKKTIENDVLPLLHEEEKLSEKDRRFLNNVLRALLLFYEGFVGDSTAKEIDLAELFDIASTMEMYDYYSLKFYADGEDARKVYAKEGDIYRVILNLVRNAVEAMESERGKIKGKGRFEYRGSITVYSRRDGDFVETSISDTGPGMSEEAITAFREDRSYSTKTFGGGRGLRAAKALIEKNGGTIDVESPSASLGTGELGKGTTFTLRLPLAKNTKDEIRLSASGDSSSFVVRRSSLVKNRSMGLVIARERSDRSNLFKSEIASPLAALGARNDGKSIVPKIGTAPISMGEIASPLAALGARNDGQTRFSSSGKSSDSSSLMAHSEVKWAQRLADAIKLRADEAKTRGENIIIGIETSGWVPDEQKDDMQSMGCAVKQLVETLERRGVIDNVKVALGNSKTLLESIIEKQIELKDQAPHIAILGSEATLAAEDYKALKDAFFAYVDLQKLSNLDYIQFLEMLTVTINLSFGKVGARSSNMAIEKLGEKIIRLTPIKPIDINEPDKIYRLQKRELATQA